MLFIYQELKSDRDAAYNSIENNRQKFVSALHENDARFKVIKSML